MNEETLLVYLKKIEEVWAPELLSVYTSIVQVEAYGGLAKMIACSIMAIFCVLLFRKHFKETNWDNSSPGKHEVIVMISAAWGVVNAFFVIGWVLNPWMWIGIFNPRLAAAHQILESIIK